MKQQMRKVLSLVLALTLVLGMLPVCGLAAESTDTYIADCPSFTLRGPEGVYPLENYGENGILLFFGRSGCANTRALMGELDGRIGTLEAQGVQVLANLEDTYVPEDYADMASLYPNIPFTYSDGVLRKVLFKLVEPESDGFYFPLVFVINAEGQIIHYSTGYVSDLQTLLSKAEAVSTGKPLPEPEPADENYYGSAYRYTGDNEALAQIINQQLAAKTPDIVIHDGTWDGVGDSWTGEALAYIMFDILEAGQEEYGPYMIPDTWTYYPWAQQVVISLIYAREPEAPTEPAETESEETEPTEPEETATGTCGEDLTWTLNAGTLTIAGSGNMENYFYGTNAPWYSRREEIVSVVVEEGVTGIGESAFSDCVNLTGVSLPESLTIIGGAAFARCANLSSIPIPAGVEKIGAAAFLECTGLQTVEITDIGAWCAIQFENNGNPAIWASKGLYMNGEPITDAVIPETVTSIPTVAFRNCASLRNVTIPAGVSTIGAGAFYNCTSLRSITVPEGVTGIGYEAFYGCLRLESVSLPDSVTEIGSGAFQNCAKLTDINIPEKVSEIGNFMFQDCISLSSITLPERVTSIGDHAFDNCTSLCDITILGKLTHINSNAFYNCKKLTDITLPETVKIIGAAAFYDCENLSGITLPDGLTGISTFAFYGCDKFESITIPGSVTSIGAAAFSGCKNLSSIIIQEGITSLGESAFSSVTGLRSIAIPESVVVIASRAFDSSRNLTTVHYAGTQAQKADIVIDETYNEYLLNANWHYECTGINCPEMPPVEETQPEETEPEVTEPETTEPEGTTPEETKPAPDEADGTCGEDLTWTLDDAGTLTISGTGTMANYDTEEDTPWAERREEIKTVVLEEGVTEIGAYAFASCTNLTGVTISDSVRMIGSNAFLSCGLTEVTIPEGVTQISDAAFENCGSLTDITLSASVTQIGPSAFYGCRSLATVHYGGMEVQKADISIGPENKPLTAATWHYQCEGETCESTEPGETQPEETKPTEPKPAENPFVDVAEDAYYFEPVLWAVGKGITNGMTETTFAPEGTCTRAQIVTFLWRSKGSPAPTSNTNPFADVPEGQWYTDAVLWAVENGITTGTSEATFSPDAGCTRGQVATFLWRAEGQPSSGAENIFADIAPGAYYYDAVLWAVANGVTNGMGDGTFTPDATCTRGQIVTFLHRADNIDFADPSRWKAAFRRFVIENHEVYYPDMTTYQFIYLDNDMIPELWINTGTLAGGFELAYYYNGGISKENMSGGGSLCYQEFGNVCKNSYGWQGIYGDTIYSLKAGKLEVLAEGAFEEYYGQGSDGHIDWHWNGVDVTEEEYRNNILLYIDLENCIRVEYLGYSYDEILEFLASNNCGHCGCGSIPLDENGLCDRCANGECYMCGGPLGDNHDCDDYPNVICPNCSWGMFTTGVGIEGVVCPECGTRII